MQIAQYLTQDDVRHRPIVPCNVPSAQGNFPFTIRIATDDVSIHKAIDIRALAYGRHMPELGNRLRQIEELDRAEGVVVLLAESKIDNTPLGTIRIQTNRYRPLLIEQAVLLPFENDSLVAEPTRLAVCQKAIGRLVKLALIRATYQYCLLTGIDHLVIGARSPLDREYRGLLFQEVYPNIGPIPLAYANNIPHYVLYWEILAMAVQWKMTDHPMYEFLTQCSHPDIDLQSRENTSISLN